MKIHNLTKEQVEMLDHLWSLDTIEAIEDFKQELPRFRRQQVDTLLQLIHLQMIDDELAQTEDLQLAQDMLSGLMSKNC